MNSAVRDSACPEKELLARCARTRIDPASTKKIAALLNGNLDWDCVFDQAAENSVTPLLGRQMQALPTGGVPAPVLDRLKEVCRANTIRCLFLTAELIGIFDLFHSRGIQAIAYKGPALAMQAYGDMTLRQFEDIDIIVRQSDLPKANEVMLGLGYRPRFDWIVSSGVPSSIIPGEYNYRDEKRRIMVELHTELTLRHFPKVPDLEDFSNRLTFVKLNDREIPTFSVEDTLIVLSLHGTKDFWERLLWIADISELIQRYPNLDWNVTIDRAKVLQAERMLHVALLLATNLTETPFAEEIQRRLRSDRTANDLASEVWTRLMRQNYGSLNAKGRFNFRRRMLPGTDGWRYAVRLSVVPAEEDYEMIRLPGILSPLYIALRPLRLLRKYGLNSRKV
ncbi:MAG: nucleotidyltransferase family protein [Candidatus Acidiferrales bacterium]